jgi:hypothetical protein
MAEFWTFRSFAARIVIINRWVFSSVDSLGWTTNLSPVSPVSPVAVASYRVVSNNVARALVARRLAMVYHSFLVPPVCMHTQCMVRRLINSRPLFSNTRLGFHDITFISMYWLSNTLQNIMDKYRPPTGSVTSFMEEFFMIMNNKYRLSNQYWFWPYWMGKFEKNRSVSRTHSLSNLLYLAVFGSISLDWLCGTIGSGGFGKCKTHRWFWPTCKQLDSISLGSQLVCELGENKMAGSWQVSSRIRICLCIPLYFRFYLALNKHLGVHCTLGVPF